MKLVWQQGGPKLGLGLKHYQNRVLVSRCDAGSLAASALLVGDHIIDVSGAPVTDKNVTADSIINILHDKGHVTSVIERPDNAEARHWVQQALQTQVSKLPSVQMNCDVRRIAAKARAQLKDHTQPHKSILISGVHANRVIINETIHCHYITSDPEIGDQILEVTR